MSSRGHMGSNRSATSRPAMPCACPEGCHSPAILPLNPGEATTPTPHPPARMEPLVSWRRR
eukprot:4230878-Alexandrium_andersonii.AAC.1